MDPSVIGPSSTFKPHGVTPADFVAALLDKSHYFQVTRGGSYPCGPEWSVPRRRIEDHVLYLVERGEILARLEGEARRLRRGELLWLQPGGEHEFHLASPAGARVAFLLFVLRSAQGTPRLESPFLFLPEASALLPSWRTLDEAALMSGTMRDSFTRATLAALLCRTSAATEGAARSGVGLSAEQRRKALQFTQAHPQGRFTLAEFARAVGLNPEYFSRRFKASFGEAPTPWARRERLRAAAARLAETGATVASVAAEFGYEDPFLFSRQFRRYLGVSPRGFRAGKTSN